VGYPHFQKPFFLQASAPVIDNVQKNRTQAKKIVMQAAARSLFLFDLALDHFILRLFRLPSGTGRVNVRILPSAAFETLNIGSDPDHTPNKPYSQPQGYQQKNDFQHGQQATNLKTMIKGVELMENPLRKPKSSLFQEEP
jgi:hypothetical protein